MEDLARRMRSSVAMISEIRNSARFVENYSITAKGCAINGVQNFAVSHYLL